MFGAAELELGF